MFTIKNFANFNDRCADGSENIQITSRMGQFSIIEHEQDKSVCYHTAIGEYYASKMGVRRRQLFCDLSKGSVMMQNGAMQWMLGSVNMDTGIKGVGDLVGKMFAGKATGESAVKPRYVGSGLVACEPTYKHLILTRVEDWAGGLVLDDGLFMACDGELNLNLKARSNVSSAVAGGKGLFNLMLRGSGVAALECAYPVDELVEIELQDDVLKVDGPFVVAWSASLDFEVGRAGKSLTGSAVSGEGLVNIYKGTGRVWMMPVNARASGSVLDACD